MAVGLDRDSIHVVQRLDRVRGRRGVLGDDRLGAGRRVDANDAPAISDHELPVGLDRDALGVRQVAGLGVQVGRDDGHAAARRIDAADGGPAVEAVLSGDVDEAVGGLDDAQGLVQVRPAGQDPRLSRGGVDLHHSLRAAHTRRRDQQVADLERFALEIAAAAHRGERQEDEADESRALSDGEGDAGCESVPVRRVHVPSPCRGWWYESRGCPGATPKSGRLPVPRRTRPGLAGNPEVFLGRGGGRGIALTRPQVPTSDREEIVDPLLVLGFVVASTFSLGDSRGTVTRPASTDSGS